MKIQRTFGEIYLDAKSQKASLSDIVSGKASVSIELTQDEIESIACEYETQATIKQAMRWMERMSSQIGKVGKDPALAKSLAPYVAAKFRKDRNDNEPNSDVWRLAVLEVYSDWLEGLL